MSGGLTNAQVLLNEYIKQEYLENQQYATEDDFFEFFSASQILKERDLSDEEIDAGICDASLDGGCDSIYIFADDVLIHDSVPLDQYKDQQKRGIVIDFYIIQSKNTVSFNEKSIQNWKTTCTNLLDMNKDINVFRIDITKRFAHHLIYFEICKSP